MSRCLYCGSDDRHAYSEAACSVACSIRLDERAKTTARIIGIIEQRMKRLHNICEDAAAIEWNALDDLIDAIQEDANAN